MQSLILAFALIAASPAAELKTASTHPIQYYVSLPDGWSAARQWPVIMVIESANKEFLKTLDLFVKARKNQPFILAAPLVTTNGGANYRQADTYHYPDAVWKRIDQERCKFDMDGIEAVAADLRKLYNGEEKYFLTGWEAGGHTVWAMVLQHPEHMRAVVPAVTNYAGRCLDSGFSTDTSRKSLPVAIFHVDSGRDVPPGKFVYMQSQQARKVAEEHGFGNVSERVISGKPHGPLADEVISYFASLLSR